MTVKPIEDIFKDLKKIVDSDKMLYNILSKKSIDEAVHYDEYMQTVKEHFSNTELYKYEDMFYRVFIYCFLMQDPGSPLVLSPIGTDAMLCKKAATLSGLLITDEKGKFPKDIENIIIGGNIFSGGLMVYILKAANHFEYAMLRTSYFQFLKLSWETFTSDKEYDHEKHKVYTAIINDISKNIKSFKDSAGEFNYNYLKAMIYNSMNDELDIMPHQISQAIKKKRVRQLIGD